MRVKVEKIKYNGHDLFNNLEIDFKDSNGDILSTTMKLDSLRNEDI